jgi:hypothetical protein
VKVEGNRVVVQFGLKVQQRMSAVAFIVPNQKPNTTSLYQLRKIAPVMKAPVLRFCPTEGEMDTS